MVRCCTRRTCGTVVFHLVSLIIVLLMIERLVFDTLGQMWGTMLINCMTALCTLTGIAGVCINEKIAIGVFAVWNFISLGLNLLIICVYNDIGLLRQKERYLGLSFGNDNWWRKHGISCSEEQDGSGDDLTADTECPLTYAAIETIHAAVYMFLAVITLLLSLYLLFSRAKRGYVPDDDESFNFVSVSQHYDFTRPQRHFRKWNYLSNYDTTISL